MFKKTFRWIVLLIITSLNFGCATHQPPEQIRLTTSVLNRYTEEYVTKANKALIKSKHPDAERLAGIGERIQKVINSLDKWANFKQEEQ